MTKSVAIIFGGVSTEHEVAIISAIQVIEALKKAGYQIIPVYITKQGEWLLGNDTFTNPKTFIDAQKLKAISQPCYLIPSDKPTLQYKNKFNYIYNYIYRYLDN